MEDRPVEGERRGLWPRVRRTGIAASPYLCYFMLALGVTKRLWAHHDVRLLSNNPTDHQQFLWFLSNTAWNVSHLHNPLLTDRLNAPNQVNLMANTSVLGLGIPLTPVTLIFGVTVTFALIMLLTLAGTAAAWYWVLSRHMLDSRPAAFAVGGFFGFAPGMISQAAGHPNLTAQFLVPFIIWQLFKLRVREHLVRNAVVLALLVTYQIFLNEELLFLLALGIGIFVLAYGVQRWKEMRDQFRTFVAGLLITGVVASILLVYPLTVQFFGPGHYHGLPLGVDRFVTDLASYGGFGRRSLAGNDVEAARLTLSSTEENAFFGWPLLIAVLIGFSFLIRHAVVRALAVTGAAFVIMSLGPKLLVYGHHTDITTPMRVLNHYPPFNLATSTRFALGTIPIVGLMIAFSLRSATRWARGLRWRQAVVWGIAVVVLLPIAPRPLVASDQPVPAFITSGEWRRYVDEEHTMVAVPLPRNQEMSEMRWAALQDDGFRIPRGYFMGPTSDKNIRAAWDPPPRPTSGLLATIGDSGRVPTITIKARAEAREDLKYWQAAVVVVPVRQRNATALVVAVNDLLGQVGVLDKAGGVWLWDVRPITG